ncbi:MAG: YaeQ family protein [Nitrospira sp.]|nr:YaeQ family protein [Nitrospira sp.]
MAPNATIFKATLHIADMDRHYYEDHAVTLARHPSETDERMMVRLLAFARHAHEALLFGRGIGTEDEPALWQKDLTGAIDLWIEVGEPDEKLLRQACGRATQVAVYSYGGRGADRWWEKIRATLSRCTNLTVITIPQDGSRALAQLAQRSMDLHCSIQDGQILMGDGTTAVHIELITIHPAAT